MNIDPYSIIEKHYHGHQKARDILIEHSHAVKEKALEVGLRLGLNDTSLNFIREAVMLHDIGMVLTYAPAIGCTGDRPYICHGYLGHDLLLGEGWPVHALVCERHTGTGLELEDIINQNLPIPHRPMVPVSLEEKIIAYADKFFSKDRGKLGQEQSVEKVKSKLLRYGSDKVSIFDQWHKDFGK